MSLLRAMAGWWPVVSVDVCSGVGVMAAIALYAFPGLFLVIPHAARSSAVGGAFYPALMAIVASCGCLSVLALWMTKAVDPGYLRRLIGPLDEATTSAIDAQPDSFSLPVRRKRRQPGEEAAEASAPSAAAAAASAAMSASAAHDPQTATDTEMQTHPDRHATHTHRRTHRGITCVRSLPLMMVALCALLCWCGGVAGVCAGAGGW